MSGRDRKAPASIFGDAMKVWINRNGLTKRIDLANAVEDWVDAVGPQIAAVTQALSVTPEGVMLVRVTTHAWATELGLMSPRILARLNGAKRGRVVGIRWQVGTLDQP